MRRTAPLALALTGFALVAGCGEGGQQSVTTSSTELTITVRADENAEPQTWTLRCDPPGGDHPDPAGACRALERAKDPFAPVPPDARCTLIYGGPQTATISGSWRGRHVEADYDRTDGCEINRWKAIAPVLEPET